MFMVILYKEHLPLSLDSLYTFISFLILYLKMYQVNRKLIIPFRHMNITFHHSDSCGVVILGIQWTLPLEEPGGGSGQGNKTGNVGSRSSTLFCREVFMFISVKIPRLLVLVFVNK